MSNIRNENGGGRPSADTAHTGGSVHDRQQPSRPLRHSLHWLLLLLIGAACGGTEPEEVFEPTEEQAVAMFTTMHWLRDDPAGFTVHESEDSMEIRCPKRGGAWYLGGGELRDFGTYWEFVFDIVVGTRGCVMLTNEWERFSVTTNPTYRDMLVYTTILSPFSVSVAGSIVGAFTWTFEDRSGECVVNVEVVPHPTLSLYEGDLCGFDVELDLTAFYYPERKRLGQLGRGAGCTGRASDGRRGLCVGAAW